MSNCNNNNSKIITAKTKSTRNNDKCYDFIEKTRKRKLIEKITLECLNLTIKMLQLLELDKLFFKKQKKRN